MIHRETDGTGTTEDEITRIASTMDVKGNDDGRPRETGGTKIEIATETATDIQDPLPTVTETATPNQSASKRTPQKK